MFIYIPIKLIMIEFTVFAEKSPFSGKTQKLSLDELFNFTIVCLNHVVAVVVFVVVVVVVFVVVVVHLYLSSHFISFLFLINILCRKEN